MNKTKTIISTLVLTIILTAIVLAQTNKINLRGIQQCKTIEWETQEPIYGTCQSEYQRTVCDDYPINKSCRKENKISEYQCKKSIKTVYHTKEDCQINTYEITKQINDITTETGRINFKEWGECSNQKNGNELIIICDSKLDGNNDGICQSGESCIKFVITQNGVKRYLKNSQPDFVEGDSTFFLDKLDYEVMLQ